MRHMRRPPLPRKKRWKPNLESRKISTELVVKDDVSKGVLLTAAERTFPISNTAQGPRDQGDKRLGYVQGHLVALIAKILWSLTVTCHRDWRTWDLEKQHHEYS